jgi:HK97 family phage prohead protease
MRASGTQPTIENRTVSGYACVFNSYSQDLGGFIEQIDPHALDDVVAKSDVLCLLNHDEQRGLLARCKAGKGSLTLTIDEKGLKYEFEAPDTTLGNELVEGIKRGDITASSFAFSVAEDNWLKQDDGTYIRTITRIAVLYDVSPVYHPAYTATSVELAKRSLDNFKKEEQKATLKQYYDNLFNKLNQNQ